ncbi:hypothetical protein [Natronococcus wangiae]|uniref:hypothetical protein n=1 Tax=Natronococcus wangiae TaxID=3068275 RepID=UPI00273F78C9|nr:hypothetical protein [Natronococcus sp. AD5]
MTDLVNEQVLAHTYDGGSYPDAWEAVEQYRRATRYASKHNTKSGATASALDLPRSRLRTWIDEDGAPDAMRAIETARDHGWLNCEYDDSEFAGLNALVANVLSGGSITERHYRPMFTINHRGEDSHIFDALELANVPYEVVDDRDGRADEARPSDGGTVLGRVLAVLGAPVGPKADQRLELPAYLEGAPEDVRETFVYSYLENRAIPHEGKDTLTIREERNREYLKDLTQLINDVTGGGVQLGDRDIVISSSIARELGTIR